MNVQRVKNFMKVLGVGALMIGATLLAGCGPSQVEFEKVTLANEQAKAQIDTLNKVNADLIEDGLLKDNKIADLENNQTTLELELDEKDKQIIAYNTQLAQEIAEKENLKVLEEEEIDGLELGAIVPATTLDNSDLSFLSKGKVKFDEDDYKYRETITLDNTKIGTSFTDDLELQENPYLFYTNEGALSYRTELLDEIDATEITEKKSLELPFLGDTLKIVEVDDYTITVKQTDATESFLEKETKEVLGKTVTVTYINTNEAEVKVGEVSELIQEGDSFDFGDFEVRVKQALYQPYAGGVHEVTLEFGKEVLTDYEDGDDYSEDNDNYVWEIVKNGDNLVSVGIVYNVKSDDLDDDVLPLKVGESLDFLGYFKEKFVLEDTYEYADFDMSFAEVTPADIPALRIKASGENIVIGTEEVKEAWFDGTNAYYKEDGDWKTTTDAIVLKNEDIEQTLSWDGHQVLFGDVGLSTTDFKQLGLTKDEAEDFDVTIGGANYGTTEENLLLTDGIVIDSVENSADQDEFSFKMPDKVVKGAIQITNK